MHIFELYINSILLILFNIMFGDLSMWEHGVHNILTAKFTLCGYAMPYFSMFLLLGHLTAVILYFNFFSVIISVFDSLRVEQ